MLSPREQARYDRQLILPGIGAEGQARLKAASILCVGAGGLGSPVALYLAAAGVGRLGIIDSDTVDLSNLQRQLLHDEDSVGSTKVASAQRRLSVLNSDIELEIMEDRITSANAMEIVSRFDLIVDGSDNFPTRFAVADAAWLQGKPLISGSIFQFEGQLSVFAPGDGPCYRCLFPEPPPAGAVPT